MTANIRKMEPIETRIRKYTQKQKFDIVKEAQDMKDFVTVAKKYNVDHTTVYKWRQAINKQPEKFLARKKDVKRDREVHGLKNEIDELKDVIVGQAKEIELLKKERRS